MKISDYCINHRLIFLILYCMYSKSVYIFSVNIVIIKVFVLVLTP